MNEQAETPDWQPAPAAAEQATAEAAFAAEPAAAAEAAAAAEPAPYPPAAQESLADSTTDAAASGGDRPELAVAAAFAGGFLLAQIVRRLAR